MKKPLLIICLLFAITGFSQQTQEESFPYDREWATYLPIKVGDTYFSNENLWFSENTNINNIHFDSLLPLPPGAEGNIILGSLNPEGQIVWADRFQLGGDNTIGGIAFVDEQDYLYAYGKTRDSINIGTPATHQPEFTNLWYNDTVYFNGEQGIGTYPKHAEYIVKLDTLGNRLWGTYIYGEKNATGSPVLHKRGGYLYYFGQTNSKTGIATAGTYMPVAPPPLPQEVTATYSAPYLMKFDANTGERLWGTYFPIHELNYSPDTYTEYYIPTIDSAGYAYFPYINTFIKLNPDGTYNSTLSNSDNLNYQLTIKFDSEGNIYTLARNKPNDNTNFGTAGTYKPNKTIDDEYLLIKLTPNFEKIWATYLGDMYSTYYYNNLVINEVDGELFVSGDASATGMATSDAFQPEYGGGDSDAVLMSFDMGTGQRNWFSYYGDNNEDHSRGLLINNDGSFYFRGLSYGGENIISEETLYTEADFGVWYGYVPIPFVAKFVPRKPSSVEQNQEVRFSVYPNPSSDQVYIEPINQWLDHLQIKIYTLQGKEVSVTATQMARGYELDISHLSAGVYVMKIDTGEAVVSYKLVKE